jgi:hypothetical protein
VLKNPAYRSLLVTTLIFMCLAFAFASIKLNSEKTELEKVYDIEYQEPKQFEEEITPLDNISINKVETHSAYNEAKDFIDELEQDRNSEKSEFEEKIEALDQVTKAGVLPSESAPTTVAIDKKQVTKTPASSGKSNNRNSTNSYRLIDRTAVFLPNPVYLCESGGRIVITISVNAKGKVIDVTYAASLSSTTNECLIDEALSYANQSTFTSASLKPSQMGTITYNFPGQN